MAESTDNNNDESTTSFKHLSFDRKVIELVEELRLRRVRTHSFYMMTCKILLYV